MKQKKPLSLVVALALACLQCKVANAEENDAYVFVEKTQFECFINHLPKYLENANETNLIFLSLCPNTNPSADDLAVAAQNSLPQIKVNNSPKHTNVLPLTKDELICIQLRGQNNNSFEWDKAYPVVPGFAGIRLVRAT